MSANKIIFSYCLQSIIKDLEACEMWNVKCLFYKLKIDIYKFLYIFLLIVHHCVAGIIVSSGC